MLIPTFWCGVFATLLVEFVALIGYSIYLGGTNKNG